jgi:diaminopimelate epimerase
MPIIPFTKAVALGNDFVIFDARKVALSLSTSEITRLADRRQGIGCDQVIVLLPPRVPEADVLMVFYNADGSEAEACGNGARCAAFLLMENEGKETICFQTVKSLGRASREGEGDQISLTMGQPQFSWNHIPLAHPQALQGIIYNGALPFAVNVGNPHIVFFVENVGEIPLSQIGPQFETHPAFPSRVNVGFAQILDEHSLRLRVWERGAGYTMACGTGACAAAIAAISEDFLVSRVRVIQDGGELLIHWQKGQEIVMTGSAQIVFRGKIDKIPH